MGTFILFINNMFLFCLKSAYLHKGCFVFDVLMMLDTAHNDVKGGRRRININDSRCLKFNFSLNICIQGNTKEKCIKDLTEFEKI